MYRAFNITHDDWSGISEDIGEAMYQKNGKIAKQALESFLVQGKIDGTKMRDHWFPLINADVFISHSHENKSDAIKCATWLKQRFNLTSFIDSSVWGYADDLLKLIDDNHCKTGEHSYSYELRNGSTSHVHMMLSTALAMMMDKTECVFFLKTPNSITSKDSVEQKTSSPWLYLELSLITLLRRSMPDRQKVIEETIFARKAAAAKLEFEYLVELGTLPSLGEDELVRWQNSAEGEESPAASLDLLYDLFPEP